MKLTATLSIACLFVVACSSPQDEPIDATQPDIGDAGVSMPDTAVDAGFVDVAVDLSLPGRTARWERVDTNFEILEPYFVKALAADATYLYALVLVDDSPTKSWHIVRSDDNGDTWSVVHEMSARAAEIVSFFGDLDGTLVLVVPAYTEAGVVISGDQGTTWTEVTNVPAPLNKVAARDGDVLVVAGNTTHRSVDGGMTWEPIDGGSVAAFVRAVRFAGAFWSTNEFGTRFSLADDETSWSEAESGPAGTDLWLHGGKMWLKSNDGGLMTSDEGIAWFDAPTALADRYTQVYPAPSGVHWLLAGDDATRLLMTSDQGRGAIDITFNFPLADNGGICLSRFASTTRYAFAATQSGLFDAPGCTPGDAPDAGVYRFAFED